MPYGVDDPTDEDTARRDERAIRKERERQSMATAAAIWVAKKSTLMFHRRRNRRGRHWRQIVYNNGHSVWEGMREREIGTD